MSAWSRFTATVCVLVTTAFQMAAEWNAVPAPLATTPWLDGRPTTTFVSAAPEWRPGDGDAERFVFFDAGNGARFGLLVDRTVLELRGDLFDPVAFTGLAHRRSDVTLLSPLGPGRPTRVLRLESGGLTALGSPVVVPPGGSVQLPGGAPARAEAALGLVVGAGGRSVFGLTAAVLLGSAASPSALALGPSVLRGLPPEGPGAPLALVASAGARDARRSLAERDLDRARRTIGAAGLDRGDLVVLGGPWSAALPLERGDPWARCTLPGVGPLECRVHGGTDGEAWKG